ncbi:MAG: Zinc finger, CHC2-family protein [Candidatus Uhrbacteria bacterium GW2011_GWF2_41_430]|nr:MAG: Zinc finger, CHC2-family protein [Candidatus Uhrbacteria bacterium GW2011_GWF2_41_430]
MNTSEAKDLLKNSINMKDLLPALSINVSGHGRNIRCFVHNDKYPSMTVYPDRVHCHTCQFSEDIFGTVSKVLNLSFVDAVKWLASVFMPGVEIDGTFDVEIRNRITLQRNVSEGLKAWRNKAYDRLCTLYRATQEAKRLPPDTVGFFVACMLEGTLDELTDALISKDEMDWLQVYRQLGEAWGL